jgi:hypothetical protein
MSQFSSRLVAIVLFVFAFFQFATVSAVAQSSAPVALPYTMTTLAGLSPMTATKGTACPNLPGVTSADAYGDNCLAVNGIFGASGRGGVAVDAFGDVFVADDINNTIHMINPSSGIMTLVAGGSNAACATKLDSAGDGCVAATNALASNERGIGIDPYGNIFLPGYGDHLVRMICRAASPLCTSAQIGYSEAVAGCSTGTGVTGTTGSGLDNTPALKLSAGTCTTSLGEVNTPRGVTADIYGNVYFAETATYRFRVVLGPQTSQYFSGNNPLWAALGVHYASLTQGYAYTVVDIGGATTPATTAATTKGQACSETTNSVVYSGTALDTLGDGCPLDFSSVSDASTSYVTGVAVDAAGNMIFTDPTHGLRVLFVSSAGTAGAAMTAAIQANNGKIDSNNNAIPQAGFVYMLAGGGTTALSAAPTLGTSTTVSDSTIVKVAVSPQGNIFIGDNNKVLFYDINTGYIRTLFTGTANVTAGNFCSGTSGQTSLSAYSDGCPASDSVFTNGSGLGVATDAQGNLYLYDASSRGTSGMLVRKVLAQGLAAQTLGTPLTQTFQIHFPAGAAISGPAATLTSTADMTAGTPNCTQRGDNSVDCTVAVTASPTAAGLRSAGLTVASASGSNPLANVALGGTATGSVLAFDNASATVAGTTTPIVKTNTLLSTITPDAVALDGAGNVYAANGTSIVESIGGTTYTLSTASSTPISLPATPSQIAVDQLGDVFAVNQAANAISELAVEAAGTPAAYSLSSITYSPCSGCTAAPRAIAVDNAGNLFVADQQATAANTAVYRLSSPGNPQQSQVVVASGFTTPVSLAVDNSGNVYVADQGVGEVLKFSPTVTGSYVASPTQPTLLSGVTPVAVAVDPAGDVYVQDETSASVLMVPVSAMVAAAPNPVSLSSAVTVLTKLNNPVGLAVDGMGNVYSADTHNQGITQIVRGSMLYDFGTSTTTTFAGTLSNTGNQASTGQNTTNGSNTTNLTVTLGSGTGCTASSNVVGALASGTACTLSAQLFGTGTGTIDDYIEFLPAASAIGELTLQGTLQGTSYPTTTTIGSPSGTQTYDPTANEVSFTVTVDATGTGAPSAPTGSVNVYVDSASTYTQYPLAAGAGLFSTATVTLSGLKAGNHTIAAVYPTTGQFTGSGSSTNTTGFGINQASTSVSWIPGAATQQVSQAIGAGVLNATATPAIPGTFAYTATPSAGSATGIDASSYLTIGTYSLGVTFTPNDSLDYAISTATAPTYTVTQATTTAAVGASTNVVAADGSGNYTSLSAALAALPTTGGAIYIKPGTYAGQNAISYPNVSLRGLGGDPTKVILTGEDGAFSSPFTGYLGTGTGSGNANASGDQGSATLDVSKSLYMGQTSGSTSNPIGVTNATQSTPVNFYAEYLTVQNTYNTDTTTNTTFSTASGSCADTGISQSLPALYNSGKQCNSQALALWITSDQAILNNVNLASQQDTLYAGSQGCGSTCTPARQYMWQGTITGDVDYVFGDAAMVFDHTNFFTTWHGATATGTETIEAQNKKFQTGSAQDYLSGYICNGCTLMSESPGMTNLDYGRPYGPYSTWIMLNSFVDQVNPIGWIEFSGDTNLPTSTYAEYNTQPYTDPTPGTPPYPATIFGSTTTATGGTLGGNIGAGVTGTRETTSQDPGTLEANNAIKTQLTAAEAAQYFPVTFLSATVPTQNYTGFTANWNPVTALTTAVNSFAPTGNVTLNSSGSSVTILGRPQTPGAGLIPTGTYQFLDGSTVIASGTLDASGEAFFTTNSLSTGTHSITMVYGGDANFSGSTSSAFTITVPGAPLTPTSTALVVNNANSTYGGAITGTVTVTPQSGSGTPTGTVTISSGITPLGSCTLSGGTCGFSLTGAAGAPAGIYGITASYSGDSSDAVSNSTSVTVNVARAILQVTANNYTITVGSTLPTYAATITGFVNGDTQATAVTGSPAITGSALNSNTAGNYPISISAGTLASANYNFTFTSGYLSIVPVSLAPPVATGDTRTVTEPQFPAVCQQLNAALLTVNNDIPASVDATVTNPDGARIQAALNACSASYSGSGPGQAVELSFDGSGNNAFLSGPISMPSNVTLLVDPGVTVFFSRNVQDYDKVAGTHTCGTVNNNSATGSCLPLIEIPKTSTNVGIMGFGKLDGRGGDTLINAIAPYGGFSWWGLSNAANGVGNQQNPRFIQMDSGSSNITLYKITVKNSPLFHVSTTGAVSNFTAWDVKIITPTSSRNTDGIDPGNATNFTITRSWISDGDDNVAVGASGSAPSANISVTNNHFFAGHGESIGSYTSAGASNILFDGNMAAGNGVAGLGSAVTAGGAFGTGGAADSNSTAIRIKTANDRGGLVTNIQYSNSCFLDHKSDIQFTPLYNTNTGTLTPTFQNLLIQNVAFLNDSASGGAGTLQFTGAQNGTTTNPLTVTLDNVTFPSALSTSSFVTTGTAGTETNAELTYGPGQVSANFVSAWATFAGSNGDTVTDNRTASGLLPSQCSFTYIAPELTGPNGLPQTISQGENATLFVILTPAVGGAAYPTGTVTLTDAFNGATTTVTLTGTGDTVAIPVSGLAVGTHSFTATYSGDSNYPVPNGATYYTLAGPYTVIVNAATLNTTTTTLTVTPSAAQFGSPFTATATITGSNPTGTVNFLVNGVVYTSSVVTSGAASATINLPYSTSAYSIVAVYSGDSVNAGSTSSTSSVTVTPALTTTQLTANPTTTTLGHPVTLTATVASTAGVPSGTVSFSYTTPSNSTPVTLASATLSNGVAVTAADLPLGTNSVTANYLGTGGFAASSSTPATTVTINTPPIVPLPKNPIALPYTISTIAGGGSATVPSSGNMVCTGATDKYGDGCQATAISLVTGTDLRGVTADPFGNVYFTDIGATLIRKIAPNGVISNFAGRVSGTACVPTATTGCTPTLVSLSKPRGVSADSAGNIYIADYSGNKVYKVSVSNGQMYLVAGTGTAGYSGDGGSATSAQVSAPRNAWGDTVGNIYIADTSNNVIRVVDSTGTIHTFAGNGTKGTTGNGGPALSAEINNPQGVMVDPNLNVYVADTSSIRVVCVTCGTNSPLDALLAKAGIASPVNGNIYSIAGGGTAAATTAFQPVAANSVTMSPQKLSIDGSGNIYSSDGNGAIWFLDAQSGYVRALAANAATVCSAATDSLGDGCPATQAKFGNGGNGIGVGVDALGNMYIADTLDLRIRKVSTNLAAGSVAVASPAAAPVELHFIPGDSLASTNGLAQNSTEWLLSTPTCTANADTTADCQLTSSFTPAVPGARSTPLVVNSSAGNIGYMALTGTGLGAGATVDPASQSSFGSNLQVAGLTLDAAGNVYVSDSNSKQLLRFAAAAISQGSSATGTALATLVAPGAVAVDQRGYAYVADTSAGTVTQISPAGTSATLPFTFTTPAGLAVDALNNLYVSDSSTQTVYQINPITGAEHTLSATGLTLVSPAGLFIDPSGNLLIADPGVPAIYRFSLQSNTAAAVSTTATKPSAVVTDAAGNLLVADTASLLAVPASSNSAAFSVASLTPSALAIDAAGNLFTGSAGGVLKLARTQGYVQFSGPSAPAQTVSLLDSGNQALSLTAISQTDTSDYALSIAASTDCAVNAGAGSLAVGGACSLSAAYTPTTYLTTTDTATFVGNQVNTALSTPSSVQLVLTGPVTTPTATITLGAVSPASPVYGQPVTISATVTGASLPPAGSVVFTVDSTGVPGTLANGVWTATLTNPALGSHIFFATYTSTDGYASATSSTASFTVGQATPTITWATPTAITYGTALTATQLNATANTAGTFSYSPALGTVLGAGSQTLTATFTPKDTTDYTTATATVTLTVNPATPAITLVSSASPVFVSNPVTLTATLSSSAGTPTGSVSFYSGATLLSKVTLASGAAAYTTSALTTGTDSITAVYSGDSNFGVVTSSAASVLVEDFTIAPPSGSSSSATAPPGGQASYLLMVAPQGGSTFPQAINLTVTGLPAGATTAFSPGSTIAAGSGSTNVSLTVTLPSSASALPQHRPFSGGLPIALGLILLPFFARVRQNARRFNRIAGLVVLWIVGAALLTGLGGCSSSPKHQSQNYTLTVTATSGSLSHSTTLTLTEQQ